MGEVARRISRRGLLTNAAVGLSAMALTQGLLGRSAFAAAPSKKPTKQQIADAKASWPPAKPIGEPAMSADEKELGELLAHKAKHALALAAAHPKEKFRPGSIEAAGATLFAQVSTKRAERAHLRATKLLSAPPDAQALHFGEYAGASLAAAKVAPAVDIKLTAKLRAIVKKHKDKPVPKEKPGPSYKRIEFELNTVECIRQTHNEVGSDELLLGGHLVEPGGHVISIPKWMVSDDFDDGEAKFYDYSFCRDAFSKNVGEALGLCPHGGPGDLYRGRKLASSSLDGPWPGTWTLVMVAGEQDSGGGFGELLKTAYASLKDEINTALLALATELGTALGNLIPIPGLGAAIGAAIGLAIGAVVDWLSDAFNSKDDFVGAKTLMVRLHDAKKSTIQGKSDHPLPTPKGVWAHPMQTMTVRGDGSHYDMRLHWRAFA
jgi:hypothetical protein